MSGRRVFIGRLSPSAREKDVERFFKGYGKIRDIDLKKGFGFVEFDDPRDAKDAVYELDGKQLCSERVTIEHARMRLRGGRGRGGAGRFPGRFARESRDGGRRNPPPLRTENRLIVENLSSRVSWQDLKDFMRQAGEVTFADAHRPHLNEGVVEFAYHSDLRNALDKLSGKEINGRKIKLTEAVKKRSRTRSRSGSSSLSSRSASRSRSRSYSRSRSRSRSACSSPAQGREPKPASTPKLGTPPTPQEHARPQSPAQSPPRSPFSSPSRSPSHSPSC
ncbi:serine and arginine rich splicing factor 5b [Megalops cyprinoides]|uniref:serine and arginine rich splicing factor 5b n=1 Tax=Megalops cyprinoides TaxID=118141 RepID=UPI0018646825|nr:serine and arginine rich splicing factor 5b [Megalops cyprinoides]